MPSNKKRERLFIVVCVKVAENRLLLQGKIKTLGLIFSHETAGLLASFTTISKSLILIRPFISLHKNGEGLLIVVCVKVAGNRLLLQGKIKTLGLIFSHETAGLLASFTTISKSLIHIRTLISLHKNGEGLFIVVLVLEASLASSTGKFET